MIIKRYKCFEEADNGWKLGPYVFNHNNLIVGLSAAGKTRILNTITNISTSLQGKRPLPDGSWEIEFEIDSNVYEWCAAVKNAEIHQESIKRNNITILERDENNFVFNSTPLPKFDKKQSALALLRDEAIVKNIHESFSKIVRRNFYGPDLSSQCSVLNINPNIKNEHELNSDTAEQPMVQRLLSLKANAPEQLKTLIQAYKEIFPKIENIDVGSILLPIGIVQSCVLTELGETFPLHEAATGMQKALLILIDILCLKPGSIYIIDEIENSLGANAIMGIVDFLFEYGANIQLLITTHNPKIINNFPMDDLILISRNRKIVTPHYGCDIQKQAGNSKHEAYVLLERMMRE